MILFHLGFLIRRIDFLWWRIDFGQQVWLAQQVQYRPFSGPLMWNPGVRFFWSGNPYILNSPQWGSGKELCNSCSWLAAFASDSHICCPGKGNIRGRMVKLNEHSFPCFYREYAVLTNSGRYSMFSFKGKTITFMRGKDLQRYLRVKERNDGYLKERYIKFPIYRLWQDPPIPANKVPKSFSRMKWQSIMSCKYS